MREGRCGDEKQAVSQDALVHSRHSLSTPAGNCSVLFKYLGSESASVTFKLTLHLKPLREFGRTHIKHWGKGLNWPQGRTYNNQFLFWLFYSYTLQQGKGENDSLFKNVTSQSTAERFVFQSQLRKSNINKWQRISSFQSRASSSLISCVIFSNTYYRQFIGLQDLDWNKGVNDK